MSFLNGLSAMGASIAQFAGSAGLEAQKASLAQDSLRLADQLATTRESAGRQEAGSIAATAAGKLQDFTASESGLQRGSSEKIAANTNATSLGVAGIGAAASKYSADVGAGTARDVAGIQGSTSRDVATIGANTSLGVAGIGAAASGYSADVQSKGLYAQLDALAPSRQQEVLASQQRTALEFVQTQNAKDLRSVRAALTAEQGKDTPEPGTIARLKTQITSLETSAGTEAATTQAAAAMFRTDMDAVQHYNTQLVTATAALNQMAMGDNDRTAQKGLVENLQRQLAGAQRALQYSSDMVHGRVGAATGTAPKGVAPPPPPGVSRAALYSDTLKAWVEPDGSLIGIDGKGMMPPGVSGPPRPRGLMNSGAP